LFFVPVGLHLDVHARNPAVDRDVLHECRVLKMLLDPNHGAQRPALDEPYFVSLVQVPMLVLEISIDVPGIPALGLVYKRLQQVPTGRVLRSRGIGLGGRQRFRLAALVKQARYASGSRVHLELNEVVLQGIHSGSNSGALGKERLRGAYAVSLAAQRWHGGYQQETNRTSL